MLVAAVQIVHIGVGQGKILHMSEKEMYLEKA